MCLRQQFIGLDGTLFVFAFFVYMRHRFAIVAIIRFVNPVTLHIRTDGVTGDVTFAFSEHTHNTATGHDHYLHASNAPPEYSNGNGTVNGVPSTAVRQAVCH